MTNPTTRVIFTRCWICRIKYSHLKNTKFLTLPIKSIFEDNSAKSQDVLLTGNIMNSSLNNDYSNAASYSSQLSNSNQSIFKKIGFREIYKNKILGKLNIHSLPDFWSL